MGQSRAIWVNVGLYGAKWDIWVILGLFGATWVKVGTIWGEIGTIWVVLGVWVGIGDHIAYLP